ncbi:T9SS type A sorting domain-containing protein [Flavobacterium sp.]|uniref:T9SS type A sorting domain-containing protein n=1 Tax=Flavobacterium sp. TaxID=239 RepID=UPI003752721E
MKKLLLSLLLSLPTLINAQATCAAAVNITANGTITTPAITGTYQTICLATKTNIKAVWYKYTATANGEVTVSSNLPANDGITYTNDTRLSILKGATCTTLTCHDSNDDISATNFLSEKTFPVASGTTYYIQWDNYWNVGTAAATMPLQFTFNFVAAPCVRVGSADFYLPDTYTTSSANLYWNQSVSAPANYDIDWSNTFATAAGAGTIVSVPSGALTYTQGPLTGLPVSSNFRYFVRANCGASQSAWQGPYYSYLAKTLPYSTTFEDATLNFTDGFIGFTRFVSSATTTPPSYADGGDGTSMYTSNSITAISNRWGYSRAISLAANEQVTITFKTRLYSAAAPSPMSLNLTVGTAQTTASQSTIIQSLTLTDNTAYTTQTATWTAPSAGVYHFGLNNNSAIGATQTFMFMDTLGFTSILSTDDFISNKFNVYPNPAKNIVTVSTSNDAFIYNIEVLDLNGRIIKNIKYSNVSDAQINVSDLAKGLYMLNITSDLGSVSKKLIVE